MAFQVAEILKQRVYTFKAERPTVGESPFVHSPVLAPNAANLPTALHQLQSNNPSRYRVFNQLVAAILPDVRQVTVATTPRNTVEVQVWPVDPDTERTDLTVPLAESGTGISQVLAILYVTLTSEHPQPIIIDEPQSFLHPAAIQKLFDVLRRESRRRHQYIVTTHSPAVVTAAQPLTVLLVRKQDAVSQVEQIDIEDVDALRQFLAEIGARLADVFGAERILWVEGATEERCFPLVLAALVDKPSLGTVILGVHETGEFERRQARAAFDIYRRLSHGRGLLPPAVGFIFDREGRNERERNDLVRESRGSAHFLPRRMYENYLLNPEAIAAVAAACIEEVVAEPVDPVTTERVIAWLAEYYRDQENLGRAPGERLRQTDEWLSEAHGAKLLSALFRDFSQSQVLYEKVAHGEALTKWILKHSPEDLQEVGNLIDAALQVGTRVDVPTE